MKSTCGIETLAAFNAEIVNCQRCPRLVAHREQIGVLKRRAYLGETYWSRPVLGFGDPEARVVLVGLAPGAHGANRTGRVFTGDKSGEFLYRALYNAGFANQPEARHVGDGLTLRDAYITTSVRCVPPDNKPERDEMDRCRPYLAAELELLRNKQVVVALGGIALENYLRTLVDAGLITSRARFPFAHGAEYRTHSEGPILLATYHPSQQNTSTRRLTQPMLDAIFVRAAGLATAARTAAAHLR